MSFDTEPRKVGTIKVGRYIVHDDEPCKVISIDKSKPGKHGAAKARMVVVGLFSGQKKQYLSPVDKRVNVPMISKHQGTVVNVSDDSVTIMDSETYESIEMPYPDNDKDKKRLIDLYNSEKGCSVEYWVVMGAQRINLVREGTS